MYFEIIFAAAALISTSLTILVMQSIQTQPAQVEVKESIHWEGGII